MNYWYMQLHPGDSAGYNEDVIKQILSKIKVIGLGEQWKNKNGDQVNDPKQFKDVMKINDIVMIKSGSHPIALVEVLSDYYIEKNCDEDFDWFPLRRNIKLLEFFNDEINEILQKSLNAYGNSFIKAQGTLSICSGDNATFYFIKEWHKHYLKEKNMEDILTLLEHTKNLVLTGAPGTGKTYLARNIAAKLMFDKEDYLKLSKEQKEQIGYVQFHQSYDYTDFVEGLRPVDNSNSINFERKDGIFKEFCSKVIENKNIKNNDNVGNKIINILFDKLVKDIEEVGDIDDIDDIDDIVDENSKDNKNKIILRNGNIYDGKITADSNKNVIFFKPKDGKCNPYYVRKSRILELSNIFKTKKELNDLKNVHKSFKKLGYGSLSPYYYAVLKKLYEMKEDNADVSSYSFDTNQTPDKYVFIIDEINRGEVSKIFGELFNAIDPGYRGVEGKIKTQYQNLITDESDPFKNGFYVPKNVYIIATMNDIDRSVESMDFAFRRRFAWREIKASETQNMLDNDKELDPSILNDAKNRMNSLNKAIEKIEGLSSSYHIGAAYFLKLKDYNNDADKGFNSLWEYHLKPLLQEYLRGIGDIEKNLKILHNAYNLKNLNDNPTDNTQNESTNG